MTYLHTDQIRYGAEVKLVTEQKTNMAKFCFLCGVLGDKGHAHMSGGGGGGGTLKVILIH